MQHRTTPEHIANPLPGQIPVVGTNLKGVPGKGAALWAHRNCEGGMQGVSIGFNSHETCFGIPTKDATIYKRLPLAKIHKYVNIFLGWATVWATSCPNDLFFVTPIGCGLAGYTAEEIAPMFAGAVTMNNVHLPAEFWRVLSSEK